MTGPSTPRMAVLHPGQMGAAVAAQLSGQDIPVLWCPQGRSAATVERATAAGLTAVDDLGELLDRATVVLSICPPAAAEDIAYTVAEHGYRGVYVDANAINPQRAQRIAALLTNSGATMLDGAIIGPPPRTGASARLYLSGETSVGADLAALFAGTAVEAKVIGEDIGIASGLKMAYASYQKASRALAAVSHALAADLGVTEHLLIEARANARSPLADPDYLPSVAARAWRWAPEMNEVADTLTAAGLPPDLALGAATVLQRWEDDKDTNQPLHDVLRHLHTGKHAEVTSADT